MSEDERFRVRPGRIRSTRPAKVKPFLQQALRAAQKAGGTRPVGSGRGATWGRGRSASIRANRLLASRARRVIVKARVVRKARTPGALAAHLAYLQRDGVTRDGERGRLFDAASDDADGRALAELCESDRHHFRFIVAPEDGAELSSLRDFTRDLLAQAERDLGTKLDWVGVEHWNTEHPHVHVLVRGKTYAGDDLVISRDYIGRGMADRAAKIATDELGPRTDLEIRRDIGRQVEAERWTNLDRALVREAASGDGVIDTRRERGASPEEFQQEKIGRLRKLERLGLAAPAGTGRYALADDLELQLRHLGERGDIIKRMHRAMGRGGRDVDVAGFVLEGERQPVVGRLVARGLDDELKGSAYAIVDGLDGRTHHLRLPSLDASGDGGKGAIVELRRFEDMRGHTTLALAVRSDLGLAEQVTARGATWLDRQLVAREPAALGQGGFGGEVRNALAARAEHLIGEGLARRQGQRMLFARDLLATMREREVQDAAAKFAKGSGLAHRPTAQGEEVGGVYRQRLSLASGRFAMLDDGLGFSLVPWSPSLEKRLGQQVEGVSLPGGGIEWSFGRKRELGL